ncbi:MAG: hypothetical protein RRA35_07870, partial [Desulfomonilia bacterium]|nr:hypothetical protein [Desulfomonilia bacterium]
MMAGEFLFLHHLYVNMIAAILDFIAREKTEDRLGDALAFLFETCVKEQIVAQNDNLAPPLALTFLVRNLFLADTCGGAGLKPAKIRISEDSDSLRIFLDPCNSGGKLLRQGAYDGSKSSVIVRERCENILLRSAMRFPLPQQLLEKTMPFAISYFTETRRPLGLHMTQRAYEWSGGKSGVPYYCCICTSSVRQADCRWLSVTPPKDGHQPCVWHVDKTKA